MKKESTTWENIFANGTSDKCLISKIYKELPCLNSRKTKKNLKMGNGTEQTLLQRGHTNVRRHTEKCSVSLAIREMQTKTTMRYHFTAVRMAIINKSTNKCRRSYGEKGTLVHCLLLGLQTGAATMRNSMVFPQKTKNGTAFWPGNSTARIIS